MSKSQYDQFIDDDEEETCPLCVEEFDLTDKGFRPCPCGYQVCQFCYNSIKNNMNGLCPACRRVYDDKDIEYKTITPEEMLAHKARQAQKQKKTQAALQKEKQKAEADNLSRKHLAGLRVVQKNLVYVTGLQPTTHEDQLLQTLRGQEYFGQYGKIIKIVVSKAKDTSHPNSVGVYVTFERKDDAEKCIVAVNGSRNQERTLRAQFGTTKYCSAYLRGENCTNRNCMFLHEPGEANESYSRADLSALNAGSSQQSGSRPPPQAQQPVASASQPMARQSSSDQPSSPSTNRPALPSTASWASRPPPGQPTPSESRSTSNPSEPPAPIAAPTEVDQPQQQMPEDQPAPVHETPPQNAPTIPKQQSIIRRREVSPFSGLIKNFRPDDLKMLFSVDLTSQTVRDIIQSYPPLFDANGGAKRRIRRQREEEQRRMEQEAEAFQQPPALETDDNLELSGSLQLGGEPEDDRSMSQPQSAIQPPGSDTLDQRFHFGGLTSPGVSDRGLSPQQHQHMLLQSMKSPNTQGSYLNNLSQPNSFQPSNPPGHQRNTSRFSFANESSASTNVKPVANAKLMSQQSAMMPPSHFGAQQQQPHNSQFYTSNVQGPPPGIKMTGTPPVSGGMTFGQGHGFATGGLQYGTNAGFRENEERMRSLLRGGRDAGDASNKREYNNFPNYNNSSHAFPTAGGNVGPTGPPSYASLSSFSGEEKQRKKKGKKHRHANTSSSGGGMSDEHLLQQARFGSGPGGSYGGGNAGYAEDADFPPLGPSVHQQKSSLDESRGPTPPFPPGLPIDNTAASGHSTPIAPPGLRRPSAIPTDLEGTPSRPSSRASLKRTTSSQITPAVPLRPATPLAKPATAATPTSLPRSEKVHEAVRNEEVETPTKAPKGTASKSDEVKIAPAATAVAVPEVKQKAPALQPATVEPQSEVEKALEIEPGPQAVPIQEVKPAVEQKDKPTLARKTSQEVAPRALQPSSKSEATVQATDSKASPATSTKGEASKDTSKKRTPPGKLDIAAAVGKEPIAPSSATSTETSTPSVAHRVVSHTPAETAKAESPGRASPAVKSAPKTLRVVQTPKAETPPTSTASASKEPPAPVAKKPSRQPSVASIKVPGTPSSEQVSTSDYVSIPSTSQSRASSPPPLPTENSKASQAATKAKTKAQQKKDRQERAKVLEEGKQTEEPKRALPEESAQEAIVTRKKKTKKEKEPKPPKTKATVPPATGDSTPTASRAPSPPPKAVEEAPAPQAIKSVEQADPVTPTKTPGLKVSPQLPQQEPSPPLTPTLTASQLLAELRATAPPETQKCIDSLFRTPTSNHLKPTQNLNPADVTNAYNIIRKHTSFVQNLTHQDVNNLLTGEVPYMQYKNDEGRLWCRSMITPGGNYLRALSEDLEARFLELESMLRDQPAEYQFRPTKPQNDMKFPTVDLEELKRQFENNTRGITVMEQMVQDGSNMKKGAFMVDEASKYINEFIMPPATPPPGGEAVSCPRDVHFQPGAAGKPQDFYKHEGWSLDVAERQLGEARRVAEERDAALKKVMKKNRKIMGMS